MRSANLMRKTLETDIMLTLGIDGQGKTNIETGIGFFDHMLNSLCRFAYFDLDIKAAGDLQVDPHHTIEDCGIVLGQALREALGDKAGIERVADCLFPMDEALAQAAVDISNRGYLAWKVDCPDGMAGDFPVEMAEEFFRAFAVNAGITLHITLLDGKNRHHILEAVFKSVGRALGLAVQISNRNQGILSTKGTL
ncbi:MAG: imidazoleglycerol-phosphate dehydratase HisB [Peptococcaceae bacterium]|nr:imidazoleglycerol-phosphate dehydratase HisB [Peptococcaceae bacterium]